MAVSPKRNAVMLLNNTTLKPLNYHSVSVSDTRPTILHTLGNLEYILEHFPLISQE